MKSNKLAKYILIFLLVALGSLVFAKYGFDDVKNNIQDLGILAPVVLLFLRGFSVVIPVIPSTGFSLATGAVLGFKKGLLIICLADLISCSICFFIARNYGKRIVKKFTGEKFIYKIENASIKHLENNFFLMTAILMTGMFDFMSYGIGLTNTKWNKFIPALLTSIVLSNPPIVALGSGIMSGGKQFLIFAILGIIVLSIINKQINIKKSL